jgi:hypothetical protein
LPIAQLGKRGIHGASQGQRSTIITKLSLPDKEAVPAGAEQNEPSRACLLYPIVDPPWETCCFALHGKVWASRSVAGKILHDYPGLELRRGTQDTMRNGPAILNIGRLLLHHRITKSIDYLMGKVFTNINHGFPSHAPGRVAGKGQYTTLTPFNWPPGPLNRQSRLLTATFVVSKRICRQLSPLGVSKKNSDQI